MKIAFIALSGVRVCDPDLIELGLTLPGFLERGRAVASLPSLGLLTLAGMTPPEHERVYLEVADLRQADAFPDDFDLVAISSQSAQMPEALEIAARYRGLGVPVVMGGLHVTTRPQDPQSVGASAAVGEGEVIWPEILADAARGELKPLYDARGREFDLADAPMPAHELLAPALDRYNRLLVQTSRGCPWRCSFCASSTLLTPKYKQKPIDKVLAEVDVIAGLWRRPFLELADDNSFVNREYWLELLPRLAERRLRWFTETDMRVADDPELLDLMQRAGCKEVLIGFESPTSAGLDGLELRRNWKLQNGSRAREVIERIQSAGIRVNACFMVGLDGQGPSVFDDILQLVTDAVPFDVQITLPTPFPGTPLHARLQSEGRLTHDGQWARCTLFDLNFEPRGMTATQLREGFFHLVEDLYCREFTDWRIETYKERYLHGRPAAACPPPPAA